MNCKKRNLRSGACSLAQINKVPIMQNSFFSTKNNLDNSPKLLQMELLEKPTPLLSPLDEDDFSNNVHNMAFIAQDSKLVLSDSQSVISDGFSISGVSVIRANRKGSPHFISALDQEISAISGMQQWPQNSQISFAKRNFKRTKPQTIEDQSQQIQNQCTKKKMNDRNKVVTINQHSKGIQQRGYMLRSRTKPVVQEESSSNEDIRELLLNIEKQQKSANLTKNKLDSK